MTLNPDETFLYVITQGWKSGKAHEIEIWFVEHGDSYYILSGGGEKSHWVQNIQRQAAVQVRLGREGAWQPAQARIIRPESEAQLLSQVLPLFQAKYNWSDGLLVEIHPTHPTA